VIASHKVRSISSVFGGKNSNETLGTDAPEWSVRNPVAPDALAISSIAKILCPRLVAHPGRS
jgi:hypothetical protein